MYILCTKNAIAKATDISILDFKSRFNLSWLARYLPSVKFVRLFSYILFDITFAGYSATMFIKKILLFIIVCDCSYLRGTIVSTCYTATYFCTI